MAASCFSWEISGDGNTVTRLADSSTLAGKIGDNSLISRSFPNGSLVSAVQTAAGNLKLIGWQVDAGGAFQRLGDSEDQAGDASLICQALLGQPSKLTVTAVRTGSDNLKLISWADV